MVLSDDCVFCSIARGDGPASKVYEDAQVIAFLDIHPVTPGHTLVIPIEHSEGLSDLDEATGAQLFTVAARVAAALRESDLRTEGINWFLADGAAAGQEVFHTHLHVFPRYRGDGFGIRAERSIPEQSDLEDWAARIRAADRRLAAREAR